MKTVNRELSERTILLEESHHQNRSRGWNRMSMLSKGDNSDDEVDQMQKEIEVLKLNLKKAKKLNEEREQEAVLSAEAIQSLTEELELGDKEQKQLQQKYEKLEACCSDYEMENTELKYRLQDVLEQMKESNYTHNNTEKQQLDRVGKYKKVLEHRQEANKKKLEEMQEEHGKREQRLQNRIQQLQNELYLAE